MIAEKHKNFTTLLEKGPFRTDSLPATKEGYWGSAKKWIKELDPEARTKFTAFRDQIFQLLSVRSFSETQDLIKDDKRREEVSKRAYELIGKMYEIDGSEKEIVSTINGYAKNADSTINYLKNNNCAPSDLASKLEMINEVSITDNPVDLILMVFDEAYAPKARFEAKRKLILMNLAASIDHREKETQNKSKSKKFVDFLSNYVLSQEIKKGETETVYVLSNHASDTFACTSFEILNERVKPKQGQKITELRRRKFEINNKSISVQIDTREKTQEAKILKLLKKGMEDPAQAVDDDLGLLAVFENTRDMDKFQNRLVQGASEYGSLLSIEDVSDTLRKGEFNGNVGSHPGTKMRKFFAKMGGMRVEFILHTIDTYLDYQYKRGVAHEEYAINRIFDGGVIGLLFPKSVYNINWEEKKPQIIQQIREKIEG